MVGVGVIVVVGVVVGVCEKSTIERAAMVCIRIRIRH
jgi:hypothetical protein